MCDKINQRSKPIEVLTHVERILNMEASLRRISVSNEAIQTNADLVGFMKTLYAKKDKADATVEGLQ